MKQFDESGTGGILQEAERPFNIIEEFAALGAKRKVLLCDHLFIEGRQTFQGTVWLLWPEAKASDIRKLESFLTLLRKTAPGG